MDLSLAAAAQAVRYSTLFPGCKWWDAMTEEFQQINDAKHNHFLYSIIAILHHSVGCISMHSDSTHGAYFLAVPII